MTPLEAALVALASDLRALAVPWALVGGFAVSARAEPRFTRDVDVAVAVDGDAAAEHLVRELTARGYVLVATVEHGPSGRLATARLEAPVPAPVVVDLLFASSGVEAEVVAAAEDVELLPGVVLPVADLASLIVLKVLARDDEVRPQDAADLRAMVPLATASDLRRAGDLAALVTARGFDRGRDLVAAVEALTR